MDFPTYELNEIPVTDAMEKAFGVRPTKATLGLDLICVFESEEQVRNMNPDQALLTKIEGRISISGEAVLVAKLEIAVQEVSQVAKSIYSTEKVAFMLPLPRISLRRFLLTLSMRARRVKLQEFLS